MPVGAAVIWLIKHFLFGRYGQQDQSYVLFLQADLFPHGSPLDAAPLFWVWMSVGLVGTLVIVGIGFADADASGRARSITVLAILAALGLSAFNAWTAFWDADKQAARYSAQNTSGPPSGVPVNCGGDPSAMTTSQLAQCIQQFAAALNQRATSPTSTPSP